MAPVGAVCEICWRYYSANNKPESGEFKIGQVSTTCCLSKNCSPILNSLAGEVVAIIPNVTPVPATLVNFLLIIEKLNLREFYFQ